MNLTLLHEQRVSRSVVLFRSVGEPGAGHAFAEAAFHDKIPFETAELLVEEIVGQLDQADHHIGGDERVLVFDAFLKVS
jgi:hypothetical protein